MALSAEEYFQQGVILLSQEQYKQAIEQFNEAIKLRPGSFLLFLSYGWRGKAKRFLEYYQSALEDLNKAIELNPNFSRPYYERGAALFELEYYEIAIKNFDHALTLDEEARKSSEEHKIEDIDFVLSLLKATGGVLTFSELQFLYFYRGKSKSALKYYDSALKDFDQSIKINPGYFEAHYQKGNANVELGHYEAAVNDLNQALSLSPYFASSYYSLGVAKERLHRNEEVIADVSKAISLDPTNGEFFLQRGINYSKLGHYSQAVRDLTNAILLSRDPGMAYYNRVVAHFLGKGGLDLIILDFNRWYFLATSEQFFRFVPRLFNFFHTTYPTPYLLHRTLQKLTENFDQFNTVHPIVDATRQQCQPWKTWEEWRRLAGSEKHETLAHYHALALVNHYMGDCIEAFRIYKEILDDENAMGVPLNLMGLYYYIESAKLFREGHTVILEDAFEQIEETKADLIAQNALRELYYAGQILWANDQVVEAHELFELTDDYLPAAYMQILTLPMTGASTEDVEGKIIDIREREAALPPGGGFLHGFPARPFRLEKPGEDFLVPILHYAHYREISEALAGVRRPDEPFEHQEMWKAFYWLPEDEREIEWQQRREQLAAVNRALLEKFRGNVGAGQTVHELSVLEQAFTDKLSRDLWEGTKYLDFEDFKQKSTAWPDAAKDMAALIRTSRRLDDNDKMLLTEYCFLRGSISIEDTFLLYFYIDFVRHPLPTEAAGEGLGEAGKKLIELVVAPNTIFGQILTALGGGAAVRLFGNFWVSRNREDHIKIDDYRNPASQTPVPPDDFEVFSTNFLRFMSYQRETLGSEKFTEIYPLEGFDDWKKRQ